MGSLLSICGVALAVLALVGWVVGVADSAPNLDQLKPEVLGSQSQVFAANGQSLGYIQSDTLRTPVTASQIPQILRDATVAIEDRRFYQHGALDYEGIIRAAIRDIFDGGSTLQGASTLTMQLVDNLYPKIKAHRTLKYKIIQAKLAEQLYKEHNRAWILDSYLNDVPYGTVDGQTAYGVGAASEIFFDKPVSKLDLAQAALLAGLPQAPSEYNPFEYKQAALQRRYNVLQAMAEAHYITQAQATRAEHAGLQVHENDIYSQQGHSQPYVFDYVQQQLIQHFCPHSPNYCPQVTQGGLKIYTTINLRDEAIAKQSLDDHEGGPGQPAAALVSIDPSNGEIVAMATTSSYDQSSFDYATQAERQTGSAFKVFALMTLIHDFDGDPNTTYYDSHFLAPGWLPAYPTYSVRTAEDSYQGTINITKATVLSDNTVYAQLAQDLGMSNVSATAHAMGITSKLDNYPSEVLGAVAVSPLQMADAYATLASGGVHHAPTAISEVVFPDGSRVNLGDQPGNRVFPYGQVYAADKVLEGVITSGTGTAANYGCPAAGKTGTTSDFTDAYFDGYTSKLATAVWVGYPNETISIPDGYGGTVAAPIWHDYMEAASDGFCSDFAEPTVPWNGQPFFGHFAKTGQPITGPTGLTGVTGLTSPTGTTSPTQQTQPTTPTPQTGGAGVNPPSGFGNGHLPGHGKGH